MRPTIVVFMGPGHRQAENYLRFRFLGEGAVRFLRIPVPEPTAESAAVGSPLLGMQRSYLEMVEAWDRLQFVHGVGGQNLEREVLFFFIINLADSMQADIFIEAITSLNRQTLAVPAPLPVFIGGWLSLPGAMADDSRKSAFFRTLGRLNELFSESPNMRHRLLALRQPIVAPSPSEDNFVKEEWSFLADYLGDASVQAYLDALDEAGRQLRPLGKESPFSILKGVRLQYDGDKVLCFLCHRLVQKMMDEKLLALPQVTDEESQAWYNWYSERIRRIAGQAANSYRTMPVLSAAGADNMGDREFTAMLERYLERHLQHDAEKDSWRDLAPGPSRSTVMKSNIGRVSKPAWRF